jgi:hypothetical protein
MIHYLIIDIDNLMIYISIRVFCSIILSAQYEPATRFSIAEAAIFGMLWNLTSLRETTILMMISHFATQIDSAILHSIIVNI